MEEKRKFPRINVAEVTIGWEKEKTAPNSSQAKNISCGGVCLTFEKNAAIAVGDVLCLRFQLPKGEVINSKAKVVWTDSFDIISDTVETHSEAGVEFIDMSVDDNKAISRFVLGRLSHC